MSSRNISESSERLSGGKVRRLEDLARGRDNNYNLLRFLAAVLVLVSHSFPLSRGMSSGEPLANLVDKDMGKLAVDVFFVTSGFLVTGSLLKRRGTWAFLVARIRRVVPGLVAAVAFCVFVIGMGFTELGVKAFLMSPETWKYLAKNILLLGGAEFDLPGVFQNLPVPDVVNGSLWTLPQEARLYTLLAFLGLGVSWLGSRLRKAVMTHLLTSGAVVLVFANLTNHFYPALPKDPLQVGSMFFIGAACYMHKGRIRLSASLVLGAFLALLVSALHPDFFFVIYQITLPVIVFALAYLPGGFIRGFNRWGDYSYGLYLYAFPEQQAVAAAGVRDPVLMAGASFLLTLPLAVLSWHFVESRFLRRARESPPAPATADRDHGRDQVEPTVVEKT